jgi:ATP-dependent Lhr-like helicase
MLFVCPEQEDEEAPLPSRLPWTLLRAISVIELYTKDKWIEPFQLRSQPMGLLYHQTMSVLKSMSESSPQRLAQSVLGLPVFRDISPEDYKKLLQYLIETDHIQKTEEGTLIIGLAGERIVNNFRFYAVFKDDEEHSVFAGTEEIGSINVVPPPGYAMTLAGKAWRILEVDAKHKAVYVEQIRGKADTLWLGAGGDIHTRVLRKMREVLESEEIYRYLRPNAAQRLERARRLARETGLLRNFVLNGGGDTLYILPWVGSKQFRTLTRELKHLLAGPLGLRKILPTEPYYLTVAGIPDAEYAAEAIVNLAETPPDPYSLLEKNEAPYLGKYDEFIPPELLRKAFVADGLDIPGLSLEILKM